LLDVQVVGELLEDCSAGTRQHRRPTIRPAILGMPEVLEQDADLLHERAFMVGVASAVRWQSSPSSPSSRPSPEA